MIFSPGSNSPRVRIASVWEASSGTASCVATIRNISSTRRFVLLESSAVTDIEPLAVGELSAFGSPTKSNTYFSATIAQADIRTALAGLCEPPQMVSDCPAQLTLAHLQKAFKEHPLSPIAAFGAALQIFFI